MGISRAPLGLGMIIAEETAVRRVGSRRQTRSARL